MNPSTLHYGSVCSGIEAVSLAWQPLGWKPAWFSEIDPFPNAVLSHHYPTIPNLGDMTLIADQVRAGDVPAPDILVGGTPCQAFSLAGARNGLADPRGALTLKFVEIADAIDQKRQEHDQPPAIIVWENVPGILSDNRSNAFGCLLGALAGEGCALEPAGRRWTNAGCVAGPRRRIAWRVLNAQYFGVAQRRRRVFLVASGRDDLDPAEVLFEPCGLHGDSSPGCEEGQVPAGPARSGADRSGYLADGHYRNPRITVCFGGGNTQGPIDQAACLTARGHKCDFEVETFAAQSITGQIAHALNTANGGKGSSEDGTGRGVPVVAQPAPFAGSALAFSQNLRGEVRLEAGHGQIAGALGTGGGKPGQGYPAIATSPGENHSPEVHTGGRRRQSIVTFSAKDHGGDALENISPTIRAGSGVDKRANAGVMPAIVFDARSAVCCREIAGTIVSQHGKNSYDVELAGAGVLARSLALRGRDGGATAELGDEIASALRASSGGSDKAHVAICATGEYLEGRLLDPEESGWSQWSGWRVRRLMPIECERLQGMPDNYTLVPYRGKLAADGPRYKAIGNSMAVPCVEWLGRRIDEVLRRSGCTPIKRRRFVHNQNRETPARRVRRNTTIR